MKKRSNILFEVSGVFFVCAGVDLFFCPESKLVSQFAASLFAGIFLLLYGIVTYYQDRDKKISISEIHKLGWRHKYTGPNGSTEWAIGSNTLEWDPSVKWITIQNSEGEGMSGFCDSATTLKQLMEMFKIKKPN